MTSYGAFFTAFGLKRLGVLGIFWTKLTEGLELSSYQPLVLLQGRPVPVAHSHTLSGVPCKVRREGCVGISSYFFPTWGHASRSEFLFGNSTLGLEHMAEPSSRMRWKLYWWP